MSVHNSLTAVLNVRQMGLIALSRRIEELDEEAIDSVDRIVNSPADVLAYVRNRRELEAWRNLLNIAFKEDSDIEGAVQQLIATHDSSDRPASISMRAIATQLNRDRGIQRSAFH